MSLRLFLGALAESGHVHVDLPETPLQEEAGDSDELILAFDQMARKQLAFDAPRLRPDVAHWAAELMYRGCQLLVFRQLDSRAVKAMLGVPCPRPLSAETIYSADLMLRYLGDLLTMARAVAERDELVTDLLRLAKQWPLSSIGVSRIVAKEVDAEAIDVILGDRSLRQLYIDRVIARRDRARLEHPDVRTGVREALGMYDDLWPDAAAMDQTA